jgi:hypothetical protein
MDDRIFEFKPTETTIELKPINIKTNLEESIIDILKRNDVFKDDKNITIDTLTNIKPNQLNRMMKTMSFKDKYTLQRYITSNINTDNVPNSQSLNAIKQNIKTFVSQPMDDSDIKIEEKSSHPLYMKGGMFHPALKKRMLLNKNINNMDKAINNIKNNQLLRSFGAKSEYENIFSKISQINIDILQETKLKGINEYLKSTILTEKGYRAIIGNDPTKIKININKFFDSIDFIELPKSFKDNISNEPWLTKNKKRFLDDVKKIYNNKTVIDKQVSIEMIKYELGRSKGDIIITNDRTLETEDKDDIIFVKDVNKPQISKNTVKENIKAIKNDVMNRLGMTDDATYLNDQLTNIHDREIPMKEKLKLSNEIIDYIKNKYKINKTNGPAILSLGGFLAITGSSILARVLTSYIQKPIQPIYSIINPGKDDNKQKSFEQSFVDYKNNISDKLDNITKQQLINYSRKRSDPIKIKQRKSRRSVKRNRTRKDRISIINIIKNKNAE